MKILMLTPYLPYPPASGGQIRTLNLLKYLNKEHDVTLVCLYKNEKEKQYATHLSEYSNRVFVCKRPEKPWQIKNILRSVFSVTPFLVVRNYSSEARAKVTELLKKEQFDVIHAETFYIMPHIPATKIPILLVEQTIEYKVYQHFLKGLIYPIRKLLEIDIVKLKYWELNYWKKASVVAAVSVSDEEIIRRVQGIHTTVIPNGAGDDMFATELKKKDLTKPSLLFVGNFSWLQNVEAANYLIEKVFPKIAEQIPEVKLIIAGQNPTGKLPEINNPNIEVVDLKQDDTEKVVSLYQSSTLFVAPIYGPGGTRLKILAAMASGLPIVSTRTGVEGLSVKDNEDVIIADTDDEMVSGIARVLKDQTLYEKLQKNAYTCAKENYSWASISQKLVKVYETIIKIG